MRAVSDAETDVAYDPDRKPGVADLLDILAAWTGGDPHDLATRFDRYGDLKEAVADAVVGILAPIRERCLDLSEDPGHVQKALRVGAERAREVAGAKIRQAKAAIGLVPA